MYKVTNMRQSQQVEGGIITSVKADIWGSEQDKNTLISFPHAPQPSAARFFLTLDQTTPASLLIYYHHEHPSLLCSKLWRNKNCPYLFISCLLSASAGDSVADIPRLVEWKDRSSQGLQSQHILLYTFCTIGGAMTSCSCFFPFLLWNTLLKLVLLCFPVLYWLYNHSIQK